MVCAGLQAYPPRQRCWFQPNGTTQTGKQNKSQSQPIFPDPCSGLNKQAANRAGNGKAAAQSIPRKTTKNKGATHIK